MSKEKFDNVELSIFRSKYVDVEETYPDLRNNALKSDVSLW